MEPSSQKPDLRGPAIIYAIMATFFANMQLSYYATGKTITFIFEVPISVAYQLTYPIFVAVLLVASYLLLRRPGHPSVVFAGMVLGVVAAVFVHDIFTVFLPFVVGQEPVSVPVMVATASMVPSAIALLELRRAGLRPS